MRLKTKQILLLNSLIGSIDTLTGILLMLSPIFVLRLLLIPEIPLETIYLRFIGAFVASVGSAYLISALYYQEEVYPTYVKALWLYTGVIRLTVGSFLLLAVASGGLHLLWITVAVTDITFAILQLFLIRKALI